MSPTSALVRLPLVALLWAAGVATGCAAPVLDEDELADAGEVSTQGIILVERVSTADTTDTGADASALTSLTSVSAKFMRLSGSSDPERVERVVGTRLDLPAAMPGCIVLGDDDETSLDGLGRVTLLDAGDEVTLTAQGLSDPPGTAQRAIPLDRRAFPDVGGAVFGQFYTSRDATMQLPAPARYLLQSSGSLEMDGLTLTVDGPAAPSDVRVGEADIGASLDLVGGVDTTVRWRTGSDTAPGDLIYVDVTANSGTSLRCAFPDAGQGVLPGGVLGAALAPVAGQPAIDISVAVHRVREAPLAESTALDGGEMRFDLGVVGHGTLAAAHTAQ